VRDHIEDQPVVAEPKVGEAGAQLLAYEAVGTIAADDVTRADATVAPGETRSRLDVIAVIGQRCRFPAAPHLDVGE
jgi:hypothetical protein